MKHHRRADDRSGWTTTERRVASQIDVAGLAIEVTSLRDAVEAIAGLVGDGHVHHVVTVNVDQALNVRDDLEVRDAFEGARYRFADGAPVVALAKLLGVRLPGRVTGADMLPALCAYASRHHLRVALVGGGPGVSVEAARRLRGRYPRLQVVLATSPPIGFENDEQADSQLLGQLTAAEPDIVFVCLGSPKQELWVHRRAVQLPQAVYLGVGAAVDFASGRRLRAPSLMQRAGLEWLYRLSTDWRRLWRRYLVRDARFVRVVIEDLGTRRRQSRAR